MANKFKIEGLKQLDAALADLSKAAGRGVLRRAGKTAMLPLKATAEALAPVRTGKLKSSIRIETKTLRDADYRARASASFRSKGSARGIRAAKGSSGTVQVQVVAGGRAAPHAHFVERGTVKMAAQPFMRPAADGNARTVIAVLKTEIANEIDKSKARAAKRALKKALAG